MNGKGFVSGKKMAQFQRLRTEGRGGAPPREALAPDSPDLDLAELQDQLGNSTVQRLLAQQPEALAQPDGEAGVEAGEAPEVIESKAEAEAGIIKIEPAKIEYYEVSGDSLEEVQAQLKKPDEWRQVQYDYQYEVQEGRVSQVEVTIRIILWLPQWSGPEGESASPEQQAAWEQLLESFQAGEGTEFEQMSLLPREWLLGPQWTGASDEVKGNWFGMLEALHTREEHLIDPIYRRALVLQQRLLYQPEQALKRQVDQFIKEVAEEQKLYDDQWKPGEKKRVSLSKSQLLQ